MIRTRRLHARLAYVVRVDNRASVAHAAAFALRSPRRRVGDVRVGIAVDGNFFVFDKPVQAENS